ncbi:MAG: RNA methyltransferase [Acholeplasma sp.]|nr:RNA methyltransferase [Acholeplasma sp.]
MITSSENEKIKLLKKLKLKKYRDQENRFLVFGEHLIEEANKYNCIEEVFTSNENKEGTLISPILMKTINFTETPYDRVALCKKVINNIKSDKILVLEDVQDPDNVGALLRSASAFGFMHIILSDRCADIYNEKTIRASKGALFHLNIERSRNIINEVTKLQHLNYKVYSTGVKGTKEYNVDRKIVLVLGNEGSGVSKELMTISDYEVVIKTKNVESLNVAIAGSILMYEWSK